MKHYFLKGVYIMTESVREKLEKEIAKEFEDLSLIQPGSEEHMAATESLAKLYKLKIDEDRSTIERKEKQEDRWVKLGMASAELVLPLVFYATWMRRGFKFEETGAFTSQTFKGLISRFRPTK